MQLSGTSLATPVVAGTAANLLAAHPEWTPDQVKGALMLTAEPLARAQPRSAGVGALNAARAAAAVDPPNPNLALQRFLVPDPSEVRRLLRRGRLDDRRQSDPAWASVAWGSVAWGSAAWSSVAWGSVAWGSVAWGSVAWGSVAWGSVAWGSKSEDDLRQEGAYWIAGTDRLRGGQWGEGGEPVALSAATSGRALLGVAATPAGLSLTPATRWSGVSQSPANLQRRLFSAGGGWGEQVSLPGHSVAPMVARQNSSLGALVNSSSSRVLGVSPVFRAMTPTSWRRARIASATSMSPGWRVC